MKIRQIIGILLSTFFYISAANHDIKLIFKTLGGNDISTDYNFDLTEKEKTDFLEGTITQLTLIPKNTNVIPDKTGLICAELRINEINKETKEINLQVILFDILKVIEENSKKIENPNLNDESIEKLKIEQLKKLDESIQVLSWAFERHNGNDTKIEQKQRQSESKQQLGSGYDEIALFQNKLLPLLLFKYEETIQNLTKNPKGSDDFLKAATHYGENLINLMIKMNNPNKIKQINPNGPFFKNK